MQEDTNTSTTTTVGQTINLGLRAKDRAVSTASILKFFSIDIPSGTTSGTVPGLGTSGSAILVYDLTTTTNTLTITSSIIESARASGTLGTLTTAALQAAEQDIRFVLANITALPANAQSDVDASINVTATTIDVNPDLKQANESSPCAVRLHTVVVQAIADPVNVTVQQMLTNAYTEDNAINTTNSWIPNGIPMKMNVTSSIDNTDNSEYLEIKISVPVDSRYGAPIGTLKALSDPLGKITVAKVGVVGQYEEWKITIDNTMTAQAQEAALNTYLASNLFFVPAENWSGKLTGTSGIKVELFSIEEATGTQVLLKQTNDTEYINVDVLPVVSSRGTGKQYVSQSTKVMQEANIRFVRLRHPGGRPDYSDQGQCHWRRRYPNGRTYRS